ARRASARLFRKRGFDIRGQRVPELDEDLAEGHLRALTEAQLRERPIELLRCRDARVDEVQTESRLGAGRAPDETQESLELDRAERFREERGRADGARERAALGI